MNTLVCSCGSFVESSSAFRSLSGDNLALASHPRMGQRHIFQLLFYYPCVLRRRQSTRTTIDFLSRSQIAEIAPFLRVKARLENSDWAAIDDAICGTSTGKLIYSSREMFRAERFGARAKKLVIKKFHLTREPRSVS